MPSLQHVKSTSDPLSVRILRSTYKCVKLLHEYIPALESLDQRLLADFPVLYICTNDESASSIACGWKLSPPSCTMCEAFQSIHERLFRRMRGSKGKLVTIGRSNSAWNILCNGYRHAEKSGDKPTHGQARAAISNYALNTIVTAWQKPPLSRLFGTCGEDVFVQLLTTSSIFMQLENDCFVQLSGDQLSQRSIICSSLPFSRGVKRKSSSESIASPSISKKRSKVADLGDNKTASNIIFVRARIFYAQSCHNKAKPVLAGLPPLHVLCRQDLSDHELKILAYIFPRQFGLHNPFTSGWDRKRSAHAFMDYTIRDHEFLEKIIRIPKRIVHIQRLIEKLSKSHRALDYTSILKRYCPSHLDRSSRSIKFSEQKNVAFGNESEFCYATQANISISSAHSIPLRGATQAFNQAYACPNLLAYQIPHHQVHKFISACLFRVVPCELWGSNENQQVVADWARTMVQMRRYESFSLHAVMQKLQLSAMVWANPVGLASGQKLTAEGDVKKRALVEELMYWVFDGFLIPLLKTTFYITESNASGCRVCYFRHTDWERLVAPLLAGIAVKRFAKVDKAQLKSASRILGFSKLRAFPKDTGVRPVANMRRRPVSIDPATGRTELGDSINALLKPAFHVLSYEKSRNPENLGSSLSGTNDLYKVLKTLKRKVAVGTDLYFVKVDVQSCFDSINQAKLIEVLRPIIEEEDYIVQKFASVGPSSGKVGISWLSSAIPHWGQTDFIDLANKLSSALRNMFLIDQVHYSSTTRSDLLKIIEEHITCNIVKIGHKYYRQKEGIAQGSTLSVLLCNYFYAHFEQSYLGFINMDNSCLVRYVDDFLLVTSELDTAQSFVRVMSSGSKDHGLTISSSKTLVNFDFSPDALETLPRIKYGEEFPFIGLLIDTYSLGVRKDYSKYRLTRISDGLSCSLAKNPGQVFVNKLFQATKERSHIIFVDPELSTSRTVYSNIFENFVLVAYKFMALARSFGFDPRKDTTFVLNSIKSSIHFTCFTVQNRLGGRLAQLCGCTARLDAQAMMALGLQAFLQVLRSKPVIYKKILQELAKNLKAIKQKSSNLPDLLGIAERSEKLVDVVI